MKVNRRDSLVRARLLFFFLLMLLLLLLSSLTLANIYDSTKNLLGLRTICDTFSYTTHRYTACPDAGHQICMHECNGDCALKFLIDATTRWELGLSSSANKNFNSSSVVRRRRSQNDSLRDYVRTRHNRIMRHIVNLFGHCTYAQVANRAAEAAARAIHFHHVRNWFVCWHAALHERYCRRHTPYRTDWRRYVVRVCYSIIII